MSQSSTEFSNRVTAQLIDPDEFATLTPTDPESIQLTMSGWKRNKYCPNDIFYPDLRRQVGYVGLHTFPQYMYGIAFRDADGPKQREVESPAEKRRLHQRGYEHGIRIQSGANRFTMATVRYFNRLQSEGRLTPEMRQLMTRLGEYTMNELRNAWMLFEEEENYAGEVVDTLTELPFVEAQSQYLREVLKAQGVTEYDTQLEATGVISGGIAIRSLLRLDELEALSPGQTTLKRSIVQVVFEGVGIEVDFDKDNPLQEHP